MKSFFSILFSFLAITSGAKAQNVQATVDQILQAKTVSIEWPSLTVDGKKQMFLAIDATGEYSNPNLDTDYFVVRNADNVCKALKFSGASRFKAIRVDYSQDMAGRSIEVIDNGVLISEPIESVSEMDALTSHKLKHQAFGIFKFLQCMR